jgi:hypothetical protein
MAMIHLQSMLRDFIACLARAVFWHGVFCSKPTAQHVQAVEARFTVLLLLRPVSVVKGHIAVVTHHRWTAAASLDRLGDFVLNIESTWIAYLLVCVVDIDTQCQLVATIDFQADFDGGGHGYPLVKIKSISVET